MLRLTCSDAFSLADESSQESDDPDCSGGHGYDVWDAVSTRQQ